MKLRGKNALVTGASRGIGLAIARTLAAQGMRLALTWFDWPEASAAMQQEFLEQDKGHLVLQVDLRDRDAVATLADRIGREMGSLSLLVNNIERGGMPVLHGSYLKAVNRDQWRLEQETTLHAKWLVLEHCFPLLQVPQEAAIINISSIAGLTGRSGPAGLLFNDGYAAANRGVSVLTETWARLGAPSIRVNELMLGFINTRHGPGTRGWDLLTPEQQRQLLDHTLLRRTGTPEDVAEAVLFLARNADFMTGSVLRLDGGYILGGEEVPPMPDGVLEEQDR